MEEIEIRYIGFFGRGHHPAYVSGVGEVYYGQLIRVTKKQFDKLPPHEWVQAENLCIIVDMGGELCWKEREEDSLYCKLHKQEFQERAQLT